MDERTDNDTKRIYVQLRPDEQGIDDLVEVQKRLDGGHAGRIMPIEELHMTLIHFGKARDVLQTLKRETGIDDDAYINELSDYIARTEELLTDDVYTLTPHGFGRFGAHGKTLVIQYDAPAELRELHARTYGELARFFSACGVANVDDFTCRDPNFRFARELNPHITLYKGYEGSEPDAALGEIAVTFMKLVY